MGDKIVYYLIIRNRRIGSRNARHGVTSNDNNIKAALSTIVLNDRALYIESRAFRKILRDRNKGLDVALHERAYVVILHYRPGYIMCDSAKNNSF